jgi:hypothetical protein
MIKYFLLVMVHAFALTQAGAQMPCATKNIFGLWKKCGSVISGTYDHPPAGINVDSLKKALHGYSTSETWRFNADGTYLYMAQYAGEKNTRRGHFSVDENRCILKAKPMAKHHIVYIDDSCIIFWHNNPKTAYLTEYRR